MMAATQVCFSHGQESGPWGSKILAMAQTARAAGWDVASLDYQGMADPLARAAKLVAHCRELPAPPLLVGSSMGGFVALAAAAEVSVRGLFLLAPALYLPGYEEHLPEPPACPTRIVHGWRDDVVPVAGTLRWGELSRAQCLLVDGDHRLTANIQTIQRELLAFLEELRAGP